MRVSTDGAVRLLTLNRPNKLNALNTAAWSDLLRELRAAEADGAIRVILLRAEGRVFCAGNDITETSRFAGPSEARAYFLDLMVPTLAALASSRLPVIAEAHGMALGAGLELLQFCDVVLAAESCRFQLPETRIGLWATVFLGSASYTSNRRMTQYLALTGEAISAQQAVDAHLVTRVVPDDEIEDAGLHTAHIIAGRAPRATAVSKRFANHTMLTESLPVVREALTQLIADTLFSSEGREGVASFIEKRSPSFPVNPS